VVLDASIHSLAPPCTHAEWSQPPHRASHTTLALSSAGTLSPLSTLPKDQTPQALQHVGLLSMHMLSWPWYSRHLGLRARMMHASTHQHRRASTWPRARGAPATPRPRTAISQARTSTKPTGLVRQQRPCASSAPRGLQPTAIQASLGCSKHNKAHPSAAINLSALGLQ
jgi:hypothetical protein